MPAQSESLAAGLSSESLDLILMPTEKCNFRCVYCYEDFRIGRMSEDTIAGVQALLRRRAPSLRFLNISWFGGEPTLAIDIIERVNGAALENNASLRFSSTISTNGWLLGPANFLRLHSAHVEHYQITLDGAAADHDSTRIRKDGGPTYERIVRNIKDALGTDLDFKIALRVHVTEANIFGLDSFISDLAGFLGPDPRWSVYLKPIEKLGGKNDVNLSVLRSARGVAELARLNQKLGTSKRYAGDGPHHCYAAMANSFVIRADGRVGKCTVALADDRNTVGSIAPTGELRINMDRFRPWIRGLLNNDAAAMACPLLSLTNHPV